MHILKTFITLSFILLVSCSQKIKSDDVWNVISVGLPKTVTTKKSFHNMTLYILKQTHEPYFRQANGGYKSNILSSWKRNSENTFFKLCLKNDLLFKKGIKFATQDMKKGLQGYFDNKKVFVKLNIENKCLLFNFSNPMNNFFESLSSYELAPTYQEKGGDFEYGLGYFQVTSILPGKIILQRKIPLSGYYNHIHFNDYHGASDPALGRSGIEDYNRVLLSDFPNNKVKEYKKIDVTLLQTFNLAININDKDLRKKVFNCLDIEELRSAYMPNQRAFLDIKTVLPIGVLAAQKGKAQQKCHSPDKTSTKKTTLNFINWMQGNEKHLKNLFDNFQKATGVKIVIKNMTLSEFVKRAINKDKEFDLFVFALDAVKAEIEPFFVLIHGKSSILSPSIDRIEEQYKKVFNNRTTEYETEQVKTLSNMFLDEYLILPLYQEKRIFFYPTRVEGLEFGRDFLEYPEVWRLRHE
ncbi:MAG: hypothetical protein ISR65_17565 [Bacteriovoracaceae bacterium]|nr:hypothetical protein [Bacteriovoracaceae bacterium]